MASLEDLERRVIELEERLNMEAGLAASRDRDVSEMQVTLRSHTRMLEGLQETAGQHTRALANLETEMGGLRLEMRTGFQMIAALIDPQNESGPDT